MPVTDPPYLIYLHGFLSSPRSGKARQMAEACRARGLQDRLVIPFLSGGPTETMAQVQALIDAQGHRNIGLIGSSLGGFHATVLAERNDLKAVLINPAVHPQDYWADYLGQHRNFHEDVIHHVTEADVESLRQWDPPELRHPENYLLLVQTGDEVLDYRRAVARYHGARQIVQPGGDHSFQDFPGMIPVILQFLGIQN